VSWRAVFIGFGFVFVLFDDYRSFFEKCLAAAAFDIWEGAGNPILGRPYDGMFLCDVF